MTRKQYIAILVFFHFLVLAIILHKYFGVKACDELQMNVKFVEEQQVIVGSVDARLNELQLAMDSANIVSEELINEKSKKAKTLERKNSELDLENLQLSRAINDVYSDTIVVRDTTYISNKK